MKDQEPRIARLEQKLQAVSTLMVIVLLIFILQLWLITIALEEYLAARSTLAIPTFLASGVCFAFNLWLLHYLRDVDRSGHEQGEDY
jgi:hypothetical protein